jgi:uncharacterized membrane protein
MNQQSTELEQIESAIEIEIDEIPAQLVKNIESIAKIYHQQEQTDTFHLQLLDQIATVSAKPVFIYALLTFFILWWLASNLHHSGLLDWDIPDYLIQDQLLDTIALLISTAILIRQTRQEQVADRQSHLMLQLDLVTEQKIAKIISLLEELRLDLPNVRDRIDLEAEMMKQSTDPEMVINVIQENLYYCEPLDGLAPPTEPPLVPPTEPPLVPPTEPPLVPPTEPPLVPPTEPPLVPPTEPPSVL